ncbi:MAG: NADH-quinone oxidoreductase subunit M [Proteobacteria bacterium]|nr:MAG: NADH-quinone oxidoreductase subunit M [Pseudomonadota bacterium]
MNSYYILSLVVLFPAVAGFLGFLIPKENARIYAISASFIEFLLSLIMWYMYGFGVGSFGLGERFALIENFGIFYYLGVDGISLFLVILSTFMTFIALVGLSIKENLKNLVIAILFLETTMVGVFLSLDVILFYIFWELSLLPMLYIIGAWGSGRRIYAAVKFFLYTFFGSVFMLVGILAFAYFYYTTTGVWSFSLLDWYALRLPFDIQLWLFVGFFLGFAIKVPMFPFHTWLPYAHGQAPTIGSVILAAVLLKMGTYGFVRFSLPLFPDASAYFATPIAILAIIMIIYTAMIAFVQEDIKQVIAYSSISHMGVIILGTYALNAEGITGSIFLMLSHGIVSGGLFMLVGVIYDRRHTKLVNEFGGLAQIMPRYSVIFAIMLMGSVGLPLTIGFVGEFLSLAGFFKHSPFMTLLGGTGIILGAIYMLNLYRNVFFGMVTKEENKQLKDLYPRELFALVPLVVLVLALGVYPKPILEPVDLSVKKMLRLMQHKAVKIDTKKTLHVAKSIGEMR